MPQILNIRFQSIGHRRARMESLTIPFADLAGKATNTIISLRNGGGKTALMGLLFWLINPDGKMPDNRKIDEYIQGNDCSFIIIEWQLDGAEDSAGKPQRYLTGACCEFRPAATREGKELRCLFFAGKVLPEEPRLSLDGLPLTLSVQGQTHQRLLGNFRRTWLDLGAAYSHAEIVLTEVQHEWKRILEHAGIDPLLFHYQILMNTHEAGVGDLFKFKKDEEFINLFFHLTADTTIGADVTNLLEKHQDALKREKEQLLPEHRLLEKFLKHLSLLLPATQLRRSHYERILQLDYKRTRFRQDVETHLQQLTQLQQSAISRREDLQKKVRILAKEALDAKGRAAFLRLRAFQRREAWLQEERKNLRPKQQAYQHAERCWEMAAPLYQAQRAKQQRAYLEQQLLAWQQEQQPLLLQTQEAGRCYKAALYAQRDTLREALHQIERTKGDLYQESQRILEEISDHHRDIAHYQAQAQAQRRHIEEVKKIRSTLEEQQTIRPEETAEEAQQRWHQSIAQYQEQQQQVQRAWKAAEEQKRSNQKAIQEATESLANLARETKDLQKAISVMKGQKTSLEADTRLQQALELEVLHLEQLDLETYSYLRQALRALERRLLEQQRILGEQEIILKYLAEFRLLPPERNVARVVDELQTHHMLAWSGWSYLAENKNDTDARACITTHPEIVSGVLVRDKHFEQALDLLATLRIELDAPVVVASEQALREEGNAQKRVVLTPTSNALFDHQAAVQEHASRQKRFEEEQQRLRKLEHDYEQLQISAERFKRFFETYPPQWLEKQHSQLEQKNLELREKTDQKTALMERHNQLEAEAESNRLQDIESGKRRQQAENHLSQIKLNLSHLTLSIETSEQACLEEENQARKHQREIPILRQQREALAQQEKQANIQSHQLTQELGGLSFAWSDIAYYKGDPEPLPGDIPLLREHYRLACARYEQTTSQDEIVIRLKQAQEEESVKRKAFESRLPPDLSETTIAFLLEDMTDEEHIQSELKRAVEARTRIEQSVGEKEREIQENNQNILLAEQAFAPYARETSIQEEEPYVQEQDCFDQATLLEEAAQHCEVEVREAEKQINAESLTIMQQSSEIQQFQARLSDLEGIALHTQTLCQIAQNVLENPPNPEAVQALTGETMKAEIALLRQAFDTEQEVEQSLNAQRAKVTQHIRLELQLTMREHPLVTIVPFLLEKAEEEFEEDCQQLTDHFTLRKQTIEAMQRENQTHRKLILTHLTTIVDAGIKLLKSAERFSRIPAQMSIFDRRPFLRIKMKETTSEERRMKLDELLDEFITTGIIPSGVSLLQRAVRHVIHPISVETLFLSPQTSYYEPVTELAKESGGEKLTATVMLFCILVRLRSLERTHHHDASSCLILDNPFGAASRPLFVELQREVARAMKIQLIYLTGIDAPETLRMLPHIVRLRNDATEKKTGDGFIVREATEPGIQQMQIHLPQPDIIAKGDKAQEEETTRDDKKENEDQHER